MVEGDRIAEVECGQLGEENCSQSYNCMQNSSPHICQTLKNSEAIRQRFEHNTNKNFYTCLEN
jgi:hypothetical protein